MAYQIEFAYTCHIGKVRNNNEDNFWLCGESLEVENQGLSRVLKGRASLSEFPLLAVFDGMGGESCGEMASYLASRTCGQYYNKFRSGLKKDSPRFLAGLCREMNRVVCEYEKANRIDSMGTTAAVLAFGPDFVQSCNLGDSRIYCMQGKKLRRLSKDHVLGGGLFGKSPLTQYLGMPEDEILLEPAMTRESPEEGLRLLACSDGLTDMLADAEISSVLEENIPVEEIAGELLGEALRKGGRDNVTLVVCEIKEEEKTWLTRLTEKFHIKNHYVSENNV